MLTYLQVYLTFDLNTFSFFVIAEEKETNNSCRKVWTYGREYGKYFIKWRGKYVVMCFLSSLREFESLVLVYYQNRDCFWYAKRERHQSLCDIYFGSLCLRIWLLGIFMMWSGIGLRQSGILSIWSTIISCFTGFYSHVEYYYISFVYMIYLVFCLQKEMVKRTNDQ